MFGCDEILSRASRAQIFAPDPKHSASSELIGSPDTIRERLLELEAGHVDQVILLNQAGKNTHEDICSSLELFANEVMPEFHGREEEHQEWKRGVLAGDIALEEIDTDPYNFQARGKPTLPSSKERQNMVSGTAGRPDAETVTG